MGPLVSDEITATPAESEGPRASTEHPTVSNVPCVVTAIPTVRGAAGPPTIRHEYHRTAVENVLFAKDLRVGLLVTPTSVSFVLRDDYATCHELVEGWLDARDGWVDIPADPRFSIAQLCRPCAIEAASELARRAVVHQRERLKRFGAELVRGLVQFLDEISREAENQGSLSSRGADVDVATELWHEGLLLAFGTLILTRAELLENTLVPEADAAQTCGWVGELKRDLEAARGCHRDSQAEPQRYASHVGELLTRLSEALHPKAKETSLDQVESNLERFVLLRSLRLPDATCFEWLKALLFEQRVSNKDPRRGAKRRDETVPDSGSLASSRRTSKGKPRLASAATEDHDPLHHAFTSLTFTLTELAHLFESFLEFRPSFATQPMARVRKHGRELVLPHVPERCDSTALRARTPETAAKPPNVDGIVGTLPLGSFYVTDVHGRKGAGAYYTPRAIASVLTRQTLAHRLAAFDARFGQDLRAFFPWFHTLDPTMGAGVFLLEAVTQLGDALYERLLNRASQASRLEALASPFVQAPPKDAADPPPSHDALRPTSALSRRDARAHALWTRCRAACAIHCLFGVDRHPVAVNIARLALWSHCGRSAAVATALAKHLVVGDALLGPRLADLDGLPVTRRPLPEDASERLNGLRNDLSQRSTTKSVISRRTLRVLCELWSGAAQSGRKDDDDTYVRYLCSAGSPEIRPAKVQSDAIALRRLAQRVVCFEVCFPDVFRCNTRKAPGFGVVLGNPPWDSVKHNQRELLANLDHRAAELPTKRERERLVSELRTKAEIADEMDVQVESFERLKRIHDRLYRHQKQIIEGDLAGRQLDLFRLFIERAWSLLSNGGLLGFVVPSAFHTAAGAAGVRRLVFDSGSLLTYAVLRNSRRWFDISTGLEFGLLVARRGTPKESLVRFRFGLEGPEPLAAETPWLTLPRTYFETNNPYCTIPSVETAGDLRVIVTANRTERTWADFTRLTRVELRSTPTSIHRTHEARHFWDLPTDRDVRLAAGVEGEWQRMGAPIHEGATFGRFDDTWGPPPKYALMPERIRQVQRYRSSLGYYRLVMRAIVGSSPHKSIAAMIAPGTLAANSALVEGFPESRPNAIALVATAVLNSSVASFLLLTSADLNVNLFALRRMAWPSSLPERFLAHGALRLLTNHVGWLPLWHEQLGETRRPPPSELPLMGDPQARRRLHGALDAAVAHAYGLSRLEYQTVLSHFGEDATYEHGLTAFARIEATGQDFYRDEDPFHDVELVQSLPLAWAPTSTHVD
jgi:hypothetical protein